MEGVPLLTPMETPAPNPETADKAPLAASRPSPALRILFCLVAVLSVAWLFLTWQLVSASARQREGLAHFSAVQESYHEAIGKASRLLKRGSDTLTEAARRYAVTGDRAHLDAFFAEADGTRSRNHALELIDNNSLDVSSETREILHAAMARSNALFARECHALRLCAAAKGVPEDALPPRLRTESLAEEELALDPDALRDRAIGLLFDDAYFAAKAEVWDLVNEFLDRSTDEQMALLRDDAAEAQHAIANQTRIITLRLVTLFLLLALAVAAALGVIAGKSRANLRLAEELRRERDATLAAEKAKSMFFSMVSHDIRTPLNSIIGFSEMIVQGVDDEKERTEAAENVLFSARTLLALVNDVLDLSKLDANKMKFAPAPCDFPEMLARVASTFRIQAAGKDITIGASSAPMPRVMVDEERLRQILVNLASNAVKFTKKGGVELTSSFEPDVPPDAGERPGVPEPPRPGCRGTLRFSVRDTGIGIAPEDQKRIMDPFVQVGPSGTGGTGLGLTICKRLLERMGGELRLESEPGVGSTFTAVLPGVETAAPAAPEEAAEGGRAGAPAKRSSEPVRSVLVVDDVHVNLLVEKALLVRAGIADVETAPSAPKALEALRRRPFDLVLTDLWMPKMDGYALCREIRADPALAKLRVHAVTADVEARKLALSRGFDGLLLKPITADTLARFLASL